MADRSRNRPDRRTNLRQIDTMYSLKVDNLAYRTRLVDLQRCFEKFGTIGDIYVPRDQFSHSNRGYAFVRFMKQRDAEYAIDRMDGANIDGREIRVQLARYSRGAGSDGRNKLRVRRSRSRSRTSRRRSKQRSRSSSGRSRSRSNHKRSRSRSSRRSRSRSHSKRIARVENGEDDLPQEKK